MSLGEVMLRLDPGEGRVRTARAFRSMLELGDLATAVEYGAAHGAAVTTTPGDTSMASRAEVEALVRGAGARAALSRP